MKNELVYKEDVMERCAEVLTPIARRNVFEILNALDAVEPIPKYIEDSEICRHYLNGMVTMNETAFRKLMSNHKVNFKEVYDE